MEAPLSEHPVWPIGEDTPSVKAAIVLIFWTYFESRIERLLRGSMRDVPNGLMEDTLRRYGTISSRLERLYEVLHGVTYWQNLTAMGYGTVAQHVQTIRKCRNDFSHGNPGAINDRLVEAVACKMTLEHESWVCVYNKRATKKSVRE